MRKNDIRITKMDRNNRSIILTLIVTLSEWQVKKESVIPPNGDLVSVTGNYSNKGIRY